MPGVRGGGELVFNGYRLSVLQEERARWLARLHNIVNVLNAAELHT